MGAIEEGVLVISNFHPSIILNIKCNAGFQIRPVEKVTPELGTSFIRPFNLVKTNHRVSLLGEFGSRKLLRCIAWQSAQIAQGLFDDDHAGVSVESEKVSSENIAVDTPDRDQVLARGLWLLTIRRNT